MIPTVFPEGKEEGALGGLSQPPSPGCVSAYPKVLKGEGVLPTTYPCFEVSQKIFVIALHGKGPGGWEGKAVDQAALRSGAEPLGLHLRALSAPGKWALCG